MAGKTRDSNIELLRILTICGVVMLHYNGNVAFSHVTQGSLNYYVLYLLEMLFICAVNLFVLISGYFLSATTQRRTIKIMELVIQVMVIGACKYLITALVTRSGISIKTMIGAAIPNNYFVTLYIALYLISPYINLVLNKLDQRQFGILLGLCFCLFAVWPTVLDVIMEATGRSFSGLYTTNTGGSQYGYSLINFILMYLIASYLRRFDVEQKCKGVYLAVGVTVCVGALFCWQLRFAPTARSYANPFVIAVGSMIFLLFKRVSIRSRLINTLAKASFTCFLLHDLLLWHIGIEKVVNGNVMLLLGHIMVMIPLIFLASWLVWKAYDFICAPILRWLGKRLAGVDRLISICE